MREDERENPTHSCLRRDLCGRAGSASRRGIPNLQPLPQVSRTHARSVGPQLHCSRLATPPRSTCLARGCRRSSFIGTADTRHGRGNFRAQHYDPFGNQRLLRLGHALVGHGHRLDVHKMKHRTSTCTLSSLARRNVR